MDENEKICSGKENERSNRRYKYIIIIAAIVNLENNTRL